MRRRLTAGLVAAIAIAGCGSGGGDATTGGTGTVVVSAATSLKKAFTAYGEQFDGARVRLSFAGSDELAAQIRQGIRPDVFASADTKLPEQLFKAGLVLRPAVFATNELVLAVPHGATRVRSLDDLARPGTNVAIGAPGVPVGDYTRKVLDRLPAGDAKAILGNVRSQEPDVGGIVGKLAQGAVDAGFVYRSDVQGAGGKLTGIRLASGLQPTIQYGVAVVKGGANPTAARAFVDGLVHGRGATLLRANGFGAPPAS